jgi:CubicO group peptidase (beta-lactamase class C family)
VRGLLLALVVIAVRPVLAADRPKFDPAVVDQAAEAARKAWSVPGVAVVIVRDGTVIHLKGYGTRKHGADQPVTPDTLFPLASCTKAFTTAAVAALVDDDEMNWDDPVRKHLPTFHLSDPAADQLVTIRDLFSHRSGLGPHDLLWYRADWGVDETVRRIPKLPLTAPFRGGYQYSSVPVIAGGKAAANRYGEDWDVLVRDKILTPLGMKDVAFKTEQAAAFADRASGHRLTDGKVERMPELVMTEPNPAGSLFATLRGLGPWLTFQLADGRFGGKQVVSAKQLGETKQPHTPIRMSAAVKAQNPDTKQMSYAMGWVVYDHRGELVVAHGGVIDGFRVQATLLPEHGVGFALLNNLHDTKMNLALGNTLIDLLLGLKAKDWTKHYQKVEADERAAKKAERAKRDGERKADVKPTHPPEKYAGEYDQPAYGTGTVTVEGGKWEWRYSTFRVPLEHWQGDTFRVTAGQFDDDLIEFVTTADGVSAIRFRGVEFKRK